MEPAKYKKKIRLGGIEPPANPWKGFMLPLHQKRMHISLKGERDGKCEAHFMYRRNMGATTNKYNYFSLYYYLINLNTFRK